MDDFNHLKIQLKDIQAATNNFGDCKIGAGGFGEVYKGELLFPNRRRLVAFKRLDRRYGHGDVEFWKEITILSELRHKNLVSLLHFCNDNDERILVYKYASRGSLDRYLGEATLTWTQRLNICIGAANGIMYLHDPKKTQQRVLHRDIKSSNILLDDKWTAKVTDFGLSKIGPANQARSFIVSNIVGTPGYCDPVYWETGILSKECDVYSFGVVLFEVMCGRLCCEFDNDKFICILVHTWKKCYLENRLDEIIFPDLKGQINQKSLLTFAAIANRCLDRDQKQRPKIAAVVRELEVALQQQNSNQHKAKVAKTPMSNGFMEEFHHLQIGLEDVQLATNNFSFDNIIGHGGFGNVYKGELSLSGGKSMVCFKRLDLRLGLGQSEFWKEVMMLSKLKHENLVSLLHFCKEGEENILVYNYAPRGSLDRYLSDTSLTWTQRLKICIGVSHALKYLHNPMDAHIRVVHRDIKSSNILLDEDWTAKVSDFGLSKVGPANQNQTYLVSNVVGTPGYCDPLYWETGFLSKESDVYSFGVVLFEVMCGRLCYEYRNGNLTNILIPQWKKSYEEKRLDEIVFHDLEEQMDSCSLNTFSDVAYRCLNKNRKERPTMAEIMKELEIALQQHEIFEVTTRIKNLPISPILNASQNQLLKHGGLVGDGNTWLSKLENGKVCEIISAIKCISGDSLLHDSIENSRFSNVLRGVLYNGFTVKVKTHFLSLNVTYSVNLVFKHNRMIRTDHGSTHIPFKFKLDSERHYSNSCITHVREDGWMMIELCQFTSYKTEHDFEIDFLPLFTITSSSVEYFLEGIEFRPVEYVS